MTWQCILQLPSMWTLPGHAHECVNGKAQRNWNWKPSDIAGVSGARLDPERPRHYRVSRCLRRSHHLGTETALAPTPTAELGVRLQCVFLLKESCMRQ